MAELPKGARVFNVVRADSSQVFMDTVPSATAENINELKNILFNDGYQPQLNEFVSNLINRIGLTIIKNKSYNNPLGLFKKGSVPYGTDIQEIVSEISDPQQYGLTNTDMAKLLSGNTPDIKAIYFRRNRQDIFEKTVAREALMGAFDSWGKFQEFISSITTALYSSNYIKEFEYTKGLIDAVYNQGKCKTAVLSKPVDESTGKAFLKQLRALYMKMTFPSVEYNSYDLFVEGKTHKTWTDKDRIVLITTADVMASIDVDTLAGVFQLDKADILARTLVVDKFENDEILGVLCDESYIQIYDNLFKFDEFYNPRTLTTNMYLHAWGTFAIDPLANGIVLCTEAPIPVEEITLGEDVEIEPEEEEAISVTLDPVDATTDINYYVDDESVATVTKVNNSSIKVVGVADGETELHAVAENGVSDSITITVATDEG